MEAVFGSDKFNAVCYYNQKGEVSVFSFFNLNKGDKNVVKIKDFLDKFETPKPVYETLILLLEE